MTRSNLNDAISPLCASFSALSSVISHWSAATPCVAIFIKAFLTEESFSDAKSFETKEETVTESSAPFGFHVCTRTRLFSISYICYWIRSYMWFYGRQQWAISMMAKIRVQIIGNATTPLLNPVAQTFTQPSCKFIGVFTYDLTLHCRVWWKREGVIR